MTPEHKLQEALPEIRNFIKQVEQNPVHPSQNEIQSLTAQLVDKIVDPIFTGEYDTDIAIHNQLETMLRNSSSWVQAAVRGITPSRD